MTESALDHPITLVPAETTVAVNVGGQEIARSDNAVILHEKGHEPVAYVPRHDVRMDLLTRSGTQTHCPYKGDASYYSLPGQADVAWSYEDPIPGAGGISGHLAFDPAKATVSGP